MDFCGNAWDEPIGELRGFMFDVDGTLVLGDRSGRGYQVLPGAVEVLTELKARSIPFALLTNGSAYPAAVQAPRLRDVGLPVEDWQMLTPSSVTADYLSRAGVERCLVLGSPGVGHALQEAGIEIVFTGGDGYAQTLSLTDLQADTNAIINVDANGALRNIIPTQMPKVWVKGLVKIDLQ